MPELDPRLRATPGEAERRGRPRPMTAPRPRGDRAPGPPDPASEAAARAAPARGPGLSTLLLPAVAAFALVFAAGLALFWFLRPGHQAAAGGPAPGVVLSPLLVLVSWLLALIALPRLIPRGLAYALLAAATVLVATYLSREVAAWVQVLLLRIPLGA